MLPYILSPVSFISHLIVVLCLYFQVDILLNGVAVGELSVIVHESKAREEGRRLVDRLCEIIPREQFAVSY